MQASSFHKLLTIHKKPSQYSQENNCARVLFWKSCKPEGLPKETPTQVFFCEFARFLSTFFTEQLQRLFLWKLISLQIFFFKNLNLPSGNVSKQLFNTPCSTDLNLDNLDIQVSNDTVCSKTLKTVDLVQSAFTSSNSTMEKPEKWPHFGVATVKFQLAFTCSKSLMEKPKQYVKFVQSWRWGH